MKKGGIYKTQTIKIREIDAASHIKNVLEKHTAPADCSLVDLVNEILVKLGIKKVD